MLSQLRTGGPQKSETVPCPCARRPGVVRGRGLRVVTSTWWYDYRPTPLDPGPSDPDPSALGTGSTSLERTTKT